MLLKGWGHVGDSSNLVSLFTCADHGGGLYWSQRGIMRWWPPRATAHHWCRSANPRDWLWSVLARKATPQRELTFPASTSRSSLGRPCRFARGPASSRITGSLLRPPRG